MNRNLPAEAKTKRPRRNSLHRRLGHLTISAQLLKTMRLKYLRWIFGRFYPIRAEHIYHMDMFDYVGVSLDFDVVPEGERCPQYTVVIHDGKPKFIKCDF